MTSCGLWSGCLLERANALVGRALRLVQDAGVISTLGPTPASRLALGLAYLAMPLKRRLPGLDARVLRLPVDVGSATQTIAVSNAAEMLVLKEILVEGMYEVAPESPVHAGLDLGANVGVATLRFHDRWPDARIIAVEPDPVTARKLRTNVAGQRQIHVLEAAVVAGTTPHVEFVADASSWRSRVAGTADHGTVSVPAVTLEEIFDRFGLQRVDVLKIDIEGMEHEILP